MKLEAKQRLLSSRSHITSAALSLGTQKKFLTDLYQELRTKGGAFCQNGPSLYDQGPMNPFWQLGCQPSDYGMSAKEKINEITSTLKKLGWTERRRIRDNDLVVTKKDGSWPIGIVVLSKDWVSVLCTRDSDTL